MQERGCEIGGFGFGLRHTSQAAPPLGTTGSIDFGTDSGDPRALLQTSVVASDVVPSKRGEQQVLFASLDKDLRRVVKKTATLAKTFIEDDWAECLRGKERSFRTLISEIDQVHSKYRTEEKEHLLPSLLDVRGAAIGCLEVVIMAKKKSFVPVQLANPMDDLLQFLVKYTDNADSGCPPALDSVLEKLRVSGHFLNCWQDNKIAEAFKIMSPSCVSKVFAVTGANQNATDLAAWGWVTEQTLSVVVLLLRKPVVEDSESGTVTQVLEKLETAVAAAAPTYEGCEPLARLCQVLSSRVVMLKACLPERKPSPSALRAAKETFNTARAALVGDVTSFDNAWQYGALALHVSSTVTAALSVNSADQLGVQKLEVMMRTVKLLELDCADGKDFIGRVRPVLLDLDSCLGGCSSAMIEENLSSYVNLFKTIAELLVEAPSVGFPFLVANDFKVQLAAVLEHVAPQPTVKIEPTDTLQRIASDFDSVVAVAFGKSLPCLHTVSDLAAVSCKVADRFTDRLRAASVELRDTLPVVDRGLIDKQPLVVEALGTALRGTSVLANPSSTCYKELLMEWSAWERSNRCDNEASLKLPFLETLVQAAKAAATIKELCTPRFGDHISVVCSGLNEVLDTVCKSGLKDRLHLLSASLMSDAWSSMTDASSLQQLMFQDSKDLSTALEKRPFADVLKLVLVELPPNYQSTVRDALATSDGEPSTATKWPHVGPVDVAKRFLALMSEAQEFSVPGRGHFVEPRAVNKQLAMELLDLEVFINDVIYNLLALSHFWSAPEVVAPMVAKSTVSLSKSLSAARKFVESPHAAIGGAVLLKSWGFCKSWVGSIQVVADASQTQVLQMALDELTANKDDLEKLCPRWADCISDQELVEDSAK